MQKQLIKIKLAALCTALTLLGGCTSVPQTSGTATEESLTDSSYTEIVTEQSYQDTYSEVSTQDTAADTSEASVQDTEAQTEETKASEETGKFTELTDFSEVTLFTKLTDIPDLQFETSVTAKTEETSSMKNPTISEQTSKLASSGSYLANTYNALNFKEQKGFWISYLEYYRMLKNKSKAQFTANVEDCFDNIKSIGFNTVYVHARAFGDAYYDSELFPSGEQYTGTMGADTSFDALKIMIDEAHERGMSIHAWVNPMRLMTTAQIKDLPNTNKVKQWYNSSKYNGKYIVCSGGRWYLNPAYDSVVNYICDGVKEIVSKYNVDGIQIDDYFYPTTDASFDSSAYKQSGKGLSLSSWRINNVNSMVKKIYKSVHSVNNSVVFGISPQGFVDNNYNELYADVKTWCSQDGYCDYILPQVYFGFDNGTVPYEDNIELWSSMVTNKHVKLVFGLAAYKIGTIDNYAGSGKREWLNNSDIISRQMTLAKQIPNYGGVAIYRYDSLFNPSSDVSVQVSKELTNIKK